MASSSADVKADANQQKPTKVSKIPSRPSSQRVNSAGSPLPTSPNQRSKDSKIPKLPPHTPTNTRTSTGSRLSSGAGVALRSSLSKVISTRNTPTVVPPPPSEHQKLGLITSRDKPLPSPPVAQVVDPSSPPKAHRTLVDAEAGSPSGEEWPIIPPEMASSSKAPLTTNVTDVQDKQKQKQKQSITNDSRSEQNANITVEDRQSTSSSSIGLEARQLSSNNPYAKIIHAMSPNAEVATSSPLGHRTSAPSLLSVPPRISSKRSSMPLQTNSAREVPTKPARPTSAPSQLNTSSDTQKDWKTNPFSRWRSRTLSTRPGRPNVGPKISIHPDADAIILGDSKDIPKDSELRDQLLAGALPDCSMDTATGCMSRQTISNTNAPTEPRNATEPDLAESEHTSATTSSIRSMRPSLQTSAVASPRSPSLRIQPWTPTPANRTRPSGKDGTVAARLVDAITTNSNAAVKESTSEYASSLHLTEPNEEKYAAVATPAKKARNVLGLREATPKHPAGGRKVPRWMAPTISSSQRDKADRSREAIGHSSQPKADPVSAQPPSAVQTEEKKSLSLRVKAKRSFRNIFPKKKMSLETPEAPEAPDMKTKAGLTVTSIVEHVKTMPIDSATAHRSCNVAEMLLDLAKISHKAKMSMEDARRCAREAELHGLQADVHWDRLRKGLQGVVEKSEGLFNDETMQSILDIVQSMRADIGKA